VRRLKKIDVNFISLVDKGANRKKLIFKMETGNDSAFEKSILIKKLDEDQRMIFCIVYSPGEIDSQGDTASAEVIKDAAYNFMRCARTNNIDKQHDFIPDEGFVAESWIVKENESVFPDEPAGSWAVGIKVENDDTWNLIKSGEITGISLAGLAVTEEVEKQNDSIIAKIKELFRQGIEEPLNKNTAEEKDNNLLTEPVAEVIERIAHLEMEFVSLSERISKFENQIPQSRQIKRELCKEKEIIKIWT
jgi:hypothetical protein